MTSTTQRFMGAVHEEVNADVGHNAAGERVVRIDLTYQRGTAPTETTVILTRDAAITLRNLLDGLFAAAGVDDRGELVGEEYACPRCSERHMDSLVWQDDETTIHCTNCGTRYDPSAKATPPQPADQDLLEAATATLRLWNKYGLGPDEEESEPVHQALVNAIAKARRLL